MHSVSYLVNRAGTCSLVLGADNNLVLLKGSQSLWNHQGGSGSYLAMQSDCNLVFYKANGHDIWWTASTGSNYQPCRLWLLPSCELVVQDAFQNILWSSHTAQTFPSPSPQTSPPSPPSTTAPPPPPTSHETPTSSPYNPPPPPPLSVNPPHAPPPSSPSSTTLPSPPPGSPPALPPPTPPIAPSPPNVPGDFGDTLVAPQSMYSVSYLVNHAGTCSLVLGADNNLVLLEGSQSLWNHQGGSGAYLAMQSDCNLVFYKANGHDIWWTASTGSNYQPCRLWLLPSCELVVQDAFQNILWSSHTAQNFPSPPSPPSPPFWPAPAQAPGQPSPPPGPPPNVPGDFGDTLAAMQSMYSVSYLVNPAGTCTLVLGADNNLVLLEGSQSLWNHQGGSGAYLAMQSDCNLVFYKANGHDIWWTASTGSNYQPCRLWLLPSCELVVMDAFQNILWSSHTAQNFPSPPSPPLPPPFPAPVGTLLQSTVTVCANTSDCGNTTLVCALDSSGSTGVCTTLDSCTRDDYNRSTGQPPSECPANYTQNEGLCYPTCMAGYHAVGFTSTCWQTCPTYLNDTGRMCQDVVSTYSKGCCCSSIGNCCGCLAGYTDDGCSCNRDRSFQKRSYSNAGAVPLACPAALDSNAGLCYAPCLSGFTAVGRLCTQACTGRMHFQEGVYCTSTAGVQGITASAAVECPSPMPIA